MATKKNDVPAVFKRLREKLPPARHNSNVGLCNVVDGMGLVHAAYNAYSKLSFQGTSTSIVFGVPQMLKSIIQRYKGERLIVCWDGVLHPKRMKLLPEYKQHRQKKRDPVERARMEDQIKQLRRLLYRMGICQAYDRTVEGDDMVYFVTKEMVKAYRVNIVTSDKDFIQLLNHDVQIYNPRTNSPIAASGCPADFPCEIPQFVDYLCLVGDDSDDIPGYRGVGPATAGKFFRQFESIKEYLDSKKEFGGITDKERLADIYKRNRKLIDLPYFCARYYPEDYQIKYYKDSMFPSFNFERYRQFCLKYNLKTMLYPQFYNVFQC